MFKDKRLKTLEKNNINLRERLYACKSQIEDLEYEAMRYERKISEQEYREQLWEKERQELNNVITNLFIQINELNVKLSKRRDRNGK
jgi:chromosome segregation ATPase